MRNENPDGGNMDVGVLLEEAGLAYERSELNRAEELYKQALTYLDYHDRSDSPESALCLQSLAEIYHQSGQPQSAIPLYRRLLTLGEHILGPHHAEVITAAYRLATTYEQTNMDPEAEDMYKRAANSAERTFGLSHPTSQTIRNSLLGFMARKSPDEEFVMPAAFAKSPVTLPSENGHEPQAAEARPSEARFDFMPPPPPKSVSRLRELERETEETAQSQSGKQKEYQHTQSGVDFSLLAENTGPSKAIKKQLYKKPTKIKNLRYGADSNEEVVGKSLAIKNIIKRFDVIAYLTIAVIAISYFSFELFAKMNTVTSANYEDAVTSLLKTNKRFQSIDGVSGFEFAEQGPYVTLLNDVRHRNIPYVIMKGGLSDIGTMIGSAFVHKEVWYQSKDRSLMGDNGVILFAQDSKDLNISAAMKTFADFLQNYFREQRGTYPSNEKRYKDAPGLSYVNPYSEKEEIPSLTTLDLKGDKEFLFPGIKNVNADDAVLQYLRAGLPWRDPRPPRPGRIVALGLRHGVEKRGDNYYTSEMYIMAYDKDLQLISGGLPGLKYVIGLKDGKTISDSEADRKIDVEQASVHPPDRIVIVRGDSENIQMMRQAFPTTLVIVFLGSFLGFLFLEFKSRKADPQRLPQTFEVVGCLSMGLLLIIWVLHILP
jgi:tetratricopeptide (TPR) repeat protein